MPSRPAGCIEKITRRLCSVLVTKQRVKSGIGPHPVGGHDETGEYVLKPCHFRKWSGFFQSSRKSIEQGFCQYVDLRYWIVGIAGCPLRREFCHASGNARLANGFAMMTK